MQRGSEVNAAEYVGDNYRQAPLKWAEIMKPVGQIDQSLEQFKHIDVLHGLITDPPLLPYHHPQSSRRWMHGVHEQGYYPFICVHRDDVDPQLAQVCPSWSTPDIPQMVQRLKFTLPNAVVVSRPRSIPDRSRIG